MIIVSHGMTKSASTYLFQITRDLLYTCGHNQHMIKRKYLPDFKWVDGRGVDSAHNAVDASSNIIEYLNSVIPRNVFLIVKTHTAPASNLKDMLESGEVIGTSTYRAAAEAAVSLRRMAMIESADPTILNRFAALDTQSKAEAAARRQASMSNEWLNIKSVVKFSFYDVIYNTKATASIVCKQLSLEADTDSIVNYYQDDLRRIQEYVGDPAPRPARSYPQLQFDVGYWMENFMHLNGIATSKHIVQEAEDHLREFGYGQEAIDSMRTQSLMAWGLLSEK